MTHLLKFTVLLKDSLCLISVHMRVKVNLPLFNSFIDNHQHLFEPEN